MKLLQKKGASLAATLAAVIIACLGLTQRGEAVVTYTVEENNGNVILTASGSLDLSLLWDVPEYVADVSLITNYPPTGSFTYDTPLTAGNANGGSLMARGDGTVAEYSLSVYGANDFDTVGRWYYQVNGGNIWAKSGTNRTNFGGTFDALVEGNTHVGWSASTFRFSSVTGSMPSAITPDTVITFYGESISSLFGSSLDSRNPVTIYGLYDRNGVSGASPDGMILLDSVQLLLFVPEPSSTALLGLGGIALMLRRRR